MPSDPKSWLALRPQGLYCRPGDFYIDPTRAVSRAVITHGHGDHARAGHKTVLATKETLAIMQVRLGPTCYGTAQALGFGKVLEIGGVEISLAPAGHVLGSAQIVMEYGGTRVVVSGDYKRRRDPTCPAFEPVPCDVFVTEATFALPVFRHPDDRGEIGKLLQSVRIFSERAHLVGAYSLGKAQRVIALLREAGWDRPIPVHPALVALCALYREMGVPLGALSPIEAEDPLPLAGEIALCPPNALSGSLSSEGSEPPASPITAMASGWFGVRKRARQSGVDLPLILSDHADWDELVQTLQDVGAPTLWVTHGREDALIHRARTLGIDAHALSDVGFAEGPQG